jgi:hypothetical protein
LLFSWLLFFVRLTLSALFGCSVALTLCVLPSGSHCPLVMVVACVSFAAQGSRPAHIVRLGFFARLTLSGLGGFPTGVLMPPGAGRSIPCIRIPCLFFVSFLLLLCFFFLVVVSFLVGLLSPSQW